MRISIAAVLLCLSTAGLAAGPVAEAAIRRHTDIKPQPLDTALQLLAKERDLQMIYSYAVVGERQTAGAQGDLTFDEAIDSLLEDSGLSYHFLDENTVTIMPRGENAPSTEPTTSLRGEEDKSFWSRLRLAQTEASSHVKGEEPGEDRERTAGDQKVEDPAQSRTVIELEEIVVTGTHLRGANVVAPVLVFTREDFERTGAATAQQFLATLPQNFGGGQSEDTSAGKLPGLAFDPSYGTAVNLRGLGSSSTLVLVDGRRFAAGGSAEYTDVSMIPLSAVERIEILADGASALYGSDAIGGVVNFIMRKDFEGAETNLRYGDTTEGGVEQRSASQVFGTSWRNGNAFVAYDYLRQTPLNLFDRDFARNAPGSNHNPKDLIPGQDRHSVFAFGKHDLLDRLRVSFDGIYSERDANVVDWNSTSLDLNSTASTSKQYGGSLGLALDLVGSWQLKVDGNINDNIIDRDISASDLTLISSMRSTYELWSADAQLSGDVLALPWGAVKIAIGTGYRSEGYTFRDSSSAFDNELSVKAGYAELSIPIGYPRQSSGRSPISISLAGRHEEHSSFGNTLDPKFGVRWAVSDAVDVYATYGTSFKAPSVYQLDEFNTVSALLTLPDPAAPGGRTRTIFRAGNSADLKEETAETLTAGLQFDVPIGSGLKAQVNYFSIDYTDRIQSVTGNPATILNAPAYQNLVLRRGEVPDAEFNALVSELLGGTRGRVQSCPTPIDPQTGACNTSPAAFNAVIDRRLANFASVKVEGVDLSVTQHYRYGENGFRLGLNASYLLDFDQVAAVGAPVTDIVDTLYNPLDFRIRGDATWSRSVWSATLAVNYLDGYTNANATNRQTGLPLPPAAISSWTTIDLNLGYTPEGKFSAAWLNDISASLNISNIFDEAPPFVDDQFFGLGYDPANADPRGRFIAVLLSKKW